LDTHYVKKQEQQRKPHWIGILRGIEEAVGRRERGEGQQRMKLETQGDHGMRSRGYLEIAMLGRSSWMPYSKQGL
jgi:hypothetical protein